MKRLVVFFILLFSGFNLSAQTNVISLKSHSGELAQLMAETDNFGELYVPPMEIDTVKFIRNGILVECRPNSFGMEMRDFQGNIISNREYDTVRHSSITKTLTPTLKNQYSSNTVFIGFETPTATNHHFSGMKRNGISWLVGIALLLLLLNFKKFGKTLKTNAPLIVLLAIVISITSTSVAQTNVISMKSHAGETKDIFLEEDNFGNPPEDRIRNINMRYSRLKVADTVEFYRNGKIIQHYENESGQRTSDTLKDNNITKVLTPYLKNKYPKNTVFIGFKKQKSEAAKPFFEGMKLNEFSIWVAVILVFVSITALDRRKFI